MQLIGEKFSSHAEFVCVQGEKIGLLVSIADIYQGRLFFLLTHQELLWKKHERREAASKKMFL